MWQQSPEARQRLTPPSGLVLSWSETQKRTTSDTFAGTWLPLVRFTWQLSVVYGLDATWLPIGNVGSREATITALSPSCGWKMPIQGALW